VKHRQTEEFGRTAAKKAQAKQGTALEVERAVNLLCHALIQALSAPPSRVLEVLDPIQKVVNALHRFARSAHVEGGTQDGVPRHQGPNRSSHQLRADVNWNPNNMRQMISATGWVQSL
jgi:hypothetical protein